MNFYFVDVNEKLKSSLNTYNNFNPNVNNFLNRYSHVFLTYIFLNSWTNLVGEFFVDLVVQNRLISGLDD